MELQLAVAQAGIATQPNTVTSIGSVQSIFTQIEAELVQSEIYQRAMQGLQTVTEEAVTQAQALVQSLSREAIRIAVRQIAQRYHVAPNLPKSKVVSIHAKSENVPLETQEEEITLHQPETPASETPTPKAPYLALKTESAHPTPLPENNHFLKLHKRMTKAQRAQLAIQERNEICQQIGQTLKEAREAQGMSIGQLHSKTLVQVFYIKALEAGRVDQLPEDIYLRGFIRRLGSALGVDGKALAEALPKPTNATVVPSWYSPNLNGGIGQIPSLHLYLGYTALVAGAVGGLAWLSTSQESVSAIVESEALPTPESVSQSSKYSHQEVVPQGQKASIAPPEQMN